MGRNIQHNQSINDSNSNFYNQQLINPDTSGRNIAGRKTENVSNQQGNDLFA